MNNYKKIFAIQKVNERKWLKQNPNLDNGSGIYVLTRHDEYGFKYAYVGQHLSGYQHIDLSIKKHGLYSDYNPYGWKVNFITCSEQKLNDLERFYIKAYAGEGYQLRNKTSGGQDGGKAQIADYKPHKGYRDGIKQGRKNLARELRDIIDKHLSVAIKPEKENNKVSKKMFERFNLLLSEGISGECTQTCGKEFDDGGKTDYFQHGNG